jgi:predicted acyl esterase
MEGADLSAPFLFYSLLLKHQSSHHEKNLLFAFCLLLLALALRPKRCRIIKENYTKFEYQIPMRDGKKLFTSVYVPKDQTKKYPIMMDRTCYSVAPYGTDKYKGSLGPSPQFLHDGYIFVYQDVRGRWMSEGIYEEMTPELEVHKTNKDVDEGTDTYDTIDWLLKNLPNNNGKVGVWGISYPGFYTTTALLSRHPAWLPHRHRHQLPTCTAMTLSIMVRLCW